MALTAAGLRDAVDRAVIDAGASLGLARSDDLNNPAAAHLDRIGPTVSTIDRGRRVSAATAFLRPAARRPNLTIRPRTQAVRLVLADQGVTGVELRGGPGGPSTTVTARQEVLVCAGTIETVLLLERSGIGDPEVLRSAGVEPRIPSSRLGEGVVDQRAVPLQVRLRPGLGHGRRLASLPALGREALRYVVTREGLLATGGYDVACAARSDAGLPAPDLYGLVTPVALDRDAARLWAAPYAGAMFLGWQQRPSTAGSIHLSGPGPDDPPRITPRYLATETDRRAARSVLALARRLFATEPLASMVEAELLPGAGVDGDEAVDFARDHHFGLHHAVGAAAMGVTRDHVVDGHLRVRGVDGLRVVDASVFPFHVAPATMAPTMALAWQAAGLVLADR